MSEKMTLILPFYNTKISEMISRKYNMHPMEALRRFIYSETYRMLSDEELEMWNFSPIGIFDMWETEQVTGNPRNFLYIRRD